MHFTASAVLSQNRDREIGKVFAEYKDGEIRKEHVYSIPESEVDLYGDKKVYLNISENSLREFEIIT